MGRKVLRKGEAPHKSHTELYDKVTKLETEVLDRIQKLKMIPKSTVCQHFGTRHHEEESFDQQRNYYDLFWKQFILNDLGMRHAQQLQKEVSEMQRKLRKIQNLFDRREVELKPFQSRKSRSNQDESEIMCDDCSKSFRDKDAMLLHRRIKHGVDSEKKGEEESVEIYESDEIS